MKDFPILTIEMQHLRESITHALMLQNTEINEVVKQQIERQLTPEYLQCIIAAEVGPAMEKGIKRAIESFFEYGDGQKAIEQTMKEIMLQSLKAK